MFILITVIIPFECMLPCPRVMAVWVKGKRNQDQQFRLHGNLYLFHPDRDGLGCRNLLERVQLEIVVGNYVPGKRHGGWHSSLVILLYIMYPRHYIFTTTTVLSCSNNSLSLSLFFEAFQWKEL